MSRYFQVVAGQHLLEFNRGTRPFCGGSFALAHLRPGDAVAAYLHLDFASECRRGNSLDRPATAWQEKLGRQIEVSQSGGERNTRDVPLRCHVQSVHQ